MCFGFLVLKTIGTPTPHLPPPTLPVMLNIWDNSVQSEILNFHLARPGNDSESDNTRKSICWGSVLKIIESDTQPTSWKLCFLAPSKLSRLFASSWRFAFSSLYQTSFVFVFYSIFVSAFCSVFVSLHSNWSWRLSSSVEKDYLGEKKKSHERMSVAPHDKRVYSN